MADGWRVRLLSLLVCGLGSVPFPCADAGVEDEQDRIATCASDELHARAFHEFDGAGRFIRFVFLTDDNLSAMHDYVNAFLQERGKPPIEQRANSPASGLMILPFVLNGIRIPSS